MKGFEDVGFEDVSWNNFFKMSSTMQLMRGHCHKFYKHSVRLDIRKYSFSQRVVTECRVSNPGIRPFSNPEIPGWSRSNPGNFGIGEEQYFLNQMTTNTVKIPLNILELEL